MSSAVALIGMSVRVPDGASLEDFWSLLWKGQQVIGPAPDNRPVGSQVGGFLGQIDRFDTDFFRISPREAAELDPQQRLMLELVWEALEDARVIPGALRNERVGVFMGAMADDYELLLARHRNSLVISPFSLTGSRRGFLCGRVSHFLGLRGPSVTIDTAQSSSLVAAYHAVRSLQDGDCEMAIAGGVQVNLDPASQLALRELGALSADGRCRPFGAGADGFVRGEGGGVVVLKPLDAALRDGDRVHCVILGGATNNDGATPSLTAPSREAQEEMLRLAYERAGVDPGSVRYVESHGTGTRRGDPVEAAALGGVLGVARPADEPLLVGSTKANIGHLEGAAGIVGLIKAASAVSRGLLPPTPYDSGPHPEIDFTRLNIRVHDRAAAWPAGPRIAGVSAFGLGGSNCHLVLGQAPDYSGPESGGAPAATTGAVELPGDAIPWLVSGRSERALRAQAAVLADFAEANPGLTAHDIGFSLAVSRTVFDYGAVVTGNRAAGLRDLAQGRAGTWTRGRWRQGMTAVLFPGQGVQRAGMGHRLYETFPHFARALEEVSDALRAEIGVPVTEVMWGDDGRLEEPSLVQPAIFAMEVALYRLLESWGVRPDVVAGHSLGEITAAHVVGLLSLDDAAAFVAARGRLYERIPSTGAAVAVEASEDEANGALADWQDRAGIAAVNGPRSVVVAGEELVVTGIAERFAAAGRRTKRLAISRAVHSPLVAPILDELRAVTAGLDWRTAAGGSPRLVSSVTGTEVEAGRLVTTAHWASNARETVRWGDALRTLHALGARRFVEVGPGTTLTDLLPVNVADPAVTGLPCLPDQIDEVRGVSTALAAAHLAGCDVNWRSLFGTGARLIDLPTYAFQRERHWLDTPSGPSVSSVQSAGQRSPRALVAEALSQVTGLPGPVDANQTFRDLGVDSRMAVMMRDLLAASTGRDLPGSLLFDHPTPADLAAALSRDGRVAAGELGGNEAALGEPAHPWRPAAVSSPADDDIVIVGMSCRYPGGVRSPEDLWRLVDEGGDAIGPVPENRGWNIAQLPGQRAVGGFIKDAAVFDAAFFGISPREATSIDPQQRVILEAAWEAFERAGLSSDTLRGSRTGVFIGATAQDYGARMHEPEDDTLGHRLTGTAPSVISGRLAYFFGLRGPAVTVDTACSSSLVSVHMAAQAIRHGECDTAIAGGVTVMATPGMFLDFGRQQGGLAGDGRCKAFSADADGTAWAEGAGLVVLEKARAARRAGRPVLAVIRGSALNQDGASNGLTAPNGTAQEQLILEAAARAGISLADVDVVEAHGTGTALGDPVEAGALARTYGAAGNRRAPLWLGSLKSNIGHAQAAAGVGGLIKMAEAFRARRLPRTLHIRQPSPHIDWYNSGLALLTEAVPWHPGDRPRRAAVSSFGISGTNAHVILEEAVVARERAE
jgi:acyl transferase domain-containing protein